MASVQAEKCSAIENKKQTRDWRSICSIMNKMIITAPEAAKYVLFKTRQYRAGYHNRTCCFPDTNSCETYNTTRLISRKPATYIH
jgi:hypothetical protein